MKIVFLSHTIRDSVFRVGSYYLSKLLADRGHEILYISSPLSLVHIASQGIGKSVLEFDKRWKLRSLKRDEDNVLNHVPILLFPFTDHKLFGSYFIYNNCNINFSGTYRGIEQNGFAKPDLIIQDSLKLNFCQKYFNSAKRIYRATDLYTEMPGAPSSMKKAEKKAITLSNYIFTTSVPLKRHLEEAYDIESHVLRNGVNFDHFRTKREKPKEYHQLPGSICVYVGSMDERFDHDLIKKLSQQNEISIVLIGPLGRNSYTEYDNVHCLGEVHPDSLPAYLQHADVGMLPFKKIPANHNRSPMKIYEYGASGLPVVSVLLDEVRRRDSSFVYLADSDQEFISLIQKAISNKREISSRAVAESKKFSWEKITTKLLSLIQ